MALAVLNYEQQQGCFPPGNITQGPCCGTKSSGTWTLAILPFLEQQNVYNQYNFRAYNEDAPNKTVREFPMDIFTCPADRNVDKLEKPESGPGAGLDYRPGSYRAVSGRTNPATNGYMDNSEAKEVPYDWRGAMHHVGTINFHCEKMKDIRDGTTNTLLIGEFTTTTRTRRRTFWAYSYTSYNQSSLSMETRTLNTDYEKCIATPGVNGENPCKRAFGSLHTGRGLNFALCDGSVRWISTSVDLQVLNSLATIDGKEVVGGDKY
jgi:prepilin-type processing-associated H-X9-DG protein